VKKEMSPKIRRRGKARIKKFRCLWCGEILVKHILKSNYWICPECGKGFFRPRAH